MPTFGAPTVMGNHDAWAVRPVALSRLAVSPTIVPGLKLAMVQLTDDSKLWLRDLPYSAITHERRDRSEANRIAAMRRQQQDLAAKPVLGGVKGRA